MIAPELKTRLFDFMQKYYTRKQLENEEDANTMIQLHKEIYPFDTEDISNGCIGCRIKILNKLKYMYELVNSNR